MRIRSLIVVAAACAAGMACTPSSTPVRTPDANLALTKPITSGPPTNITDSVERPKSVAIWGHVDQPDAILDILGLLGGSSSSSSAASELAPYLELVDLTQPIDGVLVVRGSDITDVDPAVRIHFRDSKALFTLFSKELKFREQGDRIYARSRHRGGGGSSDPDSADAKSKDEWECDFVHGTETAVCGVPAAVDAVADWLKAGPLPPSSQQQSSPGGTGTTSSIARVSVFTDPLRGVAGDLLTRTLGAELAMFVDDTERIAIDLAATGKELDLSASLKLRSNRSRAAKDLLLAPNASPQGLTSPSPASIEAFARIRGLTEGVAFFPGGGALPKWVADLVRTARDSLGTPAERTRRDAAATAIGDAFTKPVAIGYGVRPDRIKSAVAAVRARKTTTPEREQEAAIHKLEDAIEPQLMAAITTSITTLERALRDYSSLTPPTTSTHSTTPPQLTKYSLRPATAKLGVPSGSFFFEERSPDWSRAIPTPPPSSPTAKPATTPPQQPTRVSYILFAPEKDLVWSVTCELEESCVDTMKKLLARAASPPNNNTKEPMLERSGLIVGGYFPALVGSSSMQRAMLRSASSSSGTAGMVSPSNDVLAEIERDAAAPRVALPFAITTRAAGSSQTAGTISAEMHGTRDHFRTMIDRGTFGAWRLLTMVAVLFSGS